MSKLINIEDAISTIKSGSMVGIGGNVLHRSPNALITEVIKQDKKNLKVVKTAGAYDVDLLVRAGCVASVDAGFISYETEFGLAQYYRKAVESGEVIANEHACYTVMAGLTAGKMNVPFMPVYGLKESDLIKENDYFERLIDPFSNEEITVVKAIKPDVVLIHVNECDEEGNAFIEGPIYDDVLLAKSARRVIISTERIVSSRQLALKFTQIAISSVLVDDVIHAPQGAYPCSCAKEYDIDRKRIDSFRALEDASSFETYLNEVQRVYNSKRRVK